MAFKKDKQESGKEVLANKALDESSLASVSGGTVNIYSGDCIGCNECVLSCPVIGAIYVVDRKPTITMDCIECGCCIDACPTGVLYW